jgi:hypothetical protein
MLNTMWEFVQKRDRDQVTINPIAGRRVGTLDVESEALINAVRSRKPFVLTDPFAGESVESIAHLNRGALLQVLHGDITRARRLCARAIDQCIANHEMSGHLGWMWLAINPYHNLARLDALCGETDSAVKTYRDIYAFCVEDMELTIQGVAFNARDCGQSTRGQGEDVAKSAPLAHLRDTARAMMLADRYLELLAMLEETIRDPGRQGEGPYECVCLEIVTRCLLGAEQYLRALACAEQLAQKSKVYKVGMVLMAEAYVGLGRTADALAAVDSVATLALREECSRSKAYQCSTLYHSLGCSEAALVMSKVAVEDACTRGDHAAELAAYAVMASVYGAAISGTQQSARVATLKSFSSSADRCLYREERFLAFIQLCQYASDHDLCSIGSNSREVMLDELLCELRDTNHLREKQILYLAGHNRELNATNGWGSGVRDTDIEPLCRGCLDVYDLLMDV